jgi:hypothetical protein
VTNAVIVPIVPAPYHDWTIDVGDASFGLFQWHGGHSEIYVIRDLGTVPFSAPTVAAAFILIILLLLVAGYYLISNLRHKDAAGDAKLD